MSTCRVLRPSILVVIVCVLALTAGVPAAWGQNGLPGGGPAPVPKVPIGIGDGWSATTAVPPAFFWGAGVPVFSGDSFDFTGKSCLSVTDDFDIGDRFRIYDNGAPIGETSVPAAAAMSPEVGPDAAYADPDYSSGTFIMPEGAHTITIEVIANPFDGGRGYIRVDPRGTSPFCPGVPTLPRSGSAALLAAILLLGILVLNRYAARSTTTGTG